MACQPAPVAHFVMRLPWYRNNADGAGGEGGIAYTLGIRCAHVRSRRPPPGLQARRFESLSQSAQALCSSPPIKMPARRAFLLAEREGFEPSVRVTVRLISSQVH